MPIVGTLSDFPLPEVLLLIGSRTGQLRLYDVPEFGLMEIDLAEGHAYKLRIGINHIADPSQIVAELSVVVEMGQGMFEFQAGEVQLLKINEPLPIDQLVMRLVVHVDEKLAERRAALATDLAYILENPEPEIWIESDLEQFYQDSKPYLEEGVRSVDLAKSLGLENDIVRLNLSNLRETGFVKLVDSAKLKSTRSVEIDPESSHLQLAEGISELSKRTAKLLKFWPRAA
jgi:Domain of unknown function (DUF4388)